MGGKINLFHWPYYQADVCVCNIYLLKLEPGMSIVRYIVLYIKHVYMHVNMYII